MRWQVWTAWRNISCPRFKPAGRFRNARRASSLASNSSSQTVQRDQRKTYKNSIVHIRCGWDAGWTIPFGMSGGITIMQFGLEMGGYWRNDRHDWENLFPEL